MQVQVLSLFASVIAPFGGFFASGFKRGFKIKDFGNSIPGHGGMTDRMDCQVSSVSKPYFRINGQWARFATASQRSKGNMLLPICNTRTVL